MGKLLWLLLSSTTLSLGATQDFDWSQLAPGRFGSLEEKFLGISELFKGAAYGASPLGEGGGAYDSDPLYRFDTFDCTTFIETVLALASSETKRQFLHHITKIRYLDGKAQFIFRKHFIAADWLEDNQRLGYLKNVTGEINPQSLKTARVSIDKLKWYQVSHPKELKNFKGAGLSAVQKVATSYLPTESFFQIQPKDLPTVKDLTQKLLQLEKQSIEDKENLEGQPSTLFQDIQTNLGQLKSLAPANLALLKTLPSPAIISFVRPNWYLKHKIGTNLNISHQGILYRKEGQLWLRHASHFHGRIVDEDFIDYLLRRLNHRLMKGLNITGIGGVAGPKTKPRL